METVTSDVTEESVVSEDSEVVEGTTVESVVESVVTEDSVVVETEAGVGTEGWNPPRGCERLPSPANWGGGVSARSRHLIRGVWVSRLSSPGTVAS